jgi:hypothetical protein
VKLGAGQIMSENVSVDEVVRRLETLQRSIDTLDQRFVGSREYLADQRTHNAHADANQYRISRLEEGQTWIMRGLAALSFGLLAQLVALFVQGGPG